MYYFSFIDIYLEESCLRLVLDNLGTLDKVEYHYIDHVYPDHYEDNYHRVKYDVYYSSLNERGVIFYEEKNKNFMNIFKII